MEDKELLSEIESLRTISTIQLMIFPYKSSFSSSFLTSLMIVIEISLGLTSTIQWFSNTTFTFVTT